VAELAAKGHSNPRIAQMLFITRKTVETHLSHVYGKLGVSGRVELARTLLEAAPGVAGLSPVGTPLALRK
jgi:DNA-binding CsgD family transcriptional regulator